MNSQFPLIPVLALAGAVCQGALFDSARLDDAKSLAGTGKCEVLSARIGTVDERIPCVVGGAKSGDWMRVTLRKAPGHPCVLQIQEAYPPESPGIRCTYEVHANGRRVYIRDYPGLMFGRASYFIRLDDPEVVKSPRVILRFVNRREGSPFRISGIWLYSDFDAYCRDARFATDFYLTPLLKGRGEEEKLDAEYHYLKSKIRPRSGSDVKLGCASEHHYMHRDPDAAKKEFETYLALSRKYDMPIQYAFVSWWAGTPMRKPDGQGGTLTDPKYQQICWSQTDTYDDPGLRELLGDKWDIRYGFTVPNRWSNVPWLTMNHPVLNAAKFEAIGRNLGALAEVMSRPGASKYLIGLSMENEPRYWDLHCPDERYPVERQDLMGDFNPVTVADAAKDGVTLDPKDGLDYKERLWLHENVARYQQKTYDAHARALKKLDASYLGSEADALWHDVYSHAFTGCAYPMEAVTSYHPLLEWNRLAGCRTGLEEVGQPDAAYLDVTREWGRFSQVNYEENNGRGTEWHLRTLRACYLYGARFYTFYNWQSINGEGRWAEYVREFCADEPITRVFERPDEAGSSYRSAKSHSIAVEIPPDWPMFNQVIVDVDSPGEYALTVYNDEKRDRIVGYRRMPVSKSGPARFDLPNGVPVAYGGRPLIEIVRTDRKSFGLRANPDGGAVVAVNCDTSRERMQSLLISWRADAESLISELSARKPDRIAQALRLFDKGEYRSAYEEAVRVEKLH